VGYVLWLGKHGKLAGPYTSSAQVDELLKEADDLFSQEARLDAVGWRVRNNPIGTGLQLHLRWRGRRPLIVFQAVKMDSFCSSTRGLHVHAGSR